MENSDTGALAVTRDYPNYPDSCDIFKDTDIPDTIRIPVSVVNTGKVSSGYHPLCSIAE